MRNILLHISFLLCFIPGIAQSQPVFIPDAGFRAYLVEKHANVMDTNQKLIPGKAALADMPIICPSRGISSLEGIQYFTRLKFLDCSNNNIADLSIITSCIQIENIIASNNQLISFPSLNGLTYLIKLDLSGNQLTSIPPVSPCPGLNSLIVARNKITELPSLTLNTQIVELDCSNNQLTSIPSLTTDTGLNYLNCSNNQIALLPSLSTNNLLLKINCSHNKLTSLPNLNHITALNELDCSWNEIIEMPSLNGLGSLVTLSMGHNKLSTMPNLESCINLLTIVADYNEFRAMPNLTNQGLYSLRNMNFAHNLIESIQEFPVGNIQMFDVSYNYLSFEDLRIFAIGSTYFTIFPQNSFPLGGPIQLKEGEVYSLTLPFDQDVSENTYYWKVNDNEVEVSNTGTYELKNNMSVSAEIKHPQFPGKSLTTSTLLVYTNSCANDACDEFVLSPNGDNVGDIYRIEESGSVVILNREGKIVKTMDAPAIWTGDDNLTGYFLVFLNGKKIAAVTLIR